MKLGGILAGASEADQQRLADYGRNLGMAFQIVDDVLDLTASEDVLGKPVASDLREGKATMAVLHALEHCTPAERGTIDSVLSNGGFNGITPGDIVAILKRHGSIDAAYARAVEFSNKAREAICTFPDSAHQARAALGAGVRGRTGQIRAVASGYLREHRPLGLDGGFCSDRAPVALSFTATATKVSAYRPTTVHTWAVSDTHGRRSGRRFPLTSM